MQDIREITDTGAPELLPYTDTSELRLKNELGIFVAESPKVIRTALDSGYEPLSFLAVRKYIDGQADDIIARCKGVPVYTALPETLEKLTGFRFTQGIMSAMRRKPLAEPGSVLSGARRIAVLENIMNQTNIGAIFRSAAALGADAVLLTRGCSDPLFRRTVRVSMGAVFRVPWTFIDDDTPAYIHALRNAGFATAAMALRGSSIRPDDPRLKAEKRLALIFGTEGDGLSDASVKAADYTVKIPMAHGIDSLNVAAASAVAFFCLDAGE